jgi:hypothetical protein
MTELDSDQLLKSLDAGIAAARARRSGASIANRQAIRMAGILFLVLGTAIALFALQYMAAEVAGPRHAQKTSQVTKQQ